MCARISHDNFSPGLKRLHDKIFNPGLSSTPRFKFQTLLAEAGLKFQPRG